MSLTFSGDSYFEIRQYVFVARQRFWHPASISEPHALKFRHCLFLYAPNGQFAEIESFVILIAYVLILSKSLTDIIYELRHPR